MAAKQTKATKATARGKAALRSFLAARVKAAKAEELVSESKDELLAYLLTITPNAEDKRTTVVTIGDQDYGVTLVAGDTMIVDWDGVMGLLDEAQTAACTKSVPDAHLLEAAIESGQVKASVLIENTTFKARAPFPKVTKR